MIKAFGAYLLGDSVWLSMEYCVGSILDILKLSGGTLAEEEISPICESVLKGMPLSFEMSFFLVHLFSPLLVGQVLRIFTRWVEFTETSKAPTF